MPVPSSARSRAAPRVAGFFVRRHPALVVATAAGAGLLWYAARRKARQTEDGTIDGSSKRVQARRTPSANGTRSRSRSRTAEAAATPTSE
jgi:hypothetical protein